MGLLSGRAGQYLDVLARRQGNVNTGQAAEEGWLQGEEGQTPRGMGPSYPELSGLETV